MSRFYECPVCGQPIEDGEDYCEQCGWGEDSWMDWVPGKPEPRY